MRRPHPSQSPPRRAVGMSTVSAAGLADTRTCRSFHASWHPLRVNHTPPLDWRPLSWGRQYWSTWCATDRSPRGAAQACAAWRCRLQGGQRPEKADRPDLHPLLGTPARSRGRGGLFAARVVRWSMTLDPDASPGICCTSPVESAFPWFGGGDRGDHEHTRAGDLKAPKPSSYHAVLKVHRGPDRR